MIAIQKARSEGEPDVALELLLELVDWLPDDLKEKFKEKSETIMTTMRLISSGQTEAIRKQTDLLMRYGLKRKLLRNYSQNAIREFIVQLSHELEERGYYEFKSYTDEGYGSSWRKNQPR